MLEYYDLISKSLPSLQFESEFASSNIASSYTGRNLIALRQTIREISEVPYIEQEVGALSESWLFDSPANSQRITPAQEVSIRTLVNELRIKLTLLKQIAESSQLFNKEDIVLISIPEIQSFDNLAKLANDFKKVIEIPILDEKVKGKVNILSAAEGSIILYVGLGVASAVTLIARISWSAAVLRRKSAEAKMYEQYAKTLDLKNEMLSTLINAQKVQMKNILDAEANSIANKSYNHNDPETIERLKLSISTASELIEKGVKILPLSKDSEVQKSFPNYNELHLVESTIKQLTSDGVISSSKVV